MQSNDNLLKEGGRISNNDYVSEELINHKSESKHERQMNTLLPMPLSPEVSLPVNLGSDNHDENRTVETNQTLIPIPSQINFILSDNHHFTLSQQNNPISNSNLPETTHVESHTEDKIYSNLHSVSVTDLLISNENAINNNALNLIRDYHINDVGHINIIEQKEINQSNNSFSDNISNSMTQIKVSIENVLHIENENKQPPITAASQDISIIDNNQPNMSLTNLIVENHTSTTTQMSSTTENDIPLLSTIVPQGNCDISPTRIPLSIDEVEPYLTDEVVHSLWCQLLKVRKTMGK